MLPPQCGDERRRPVVLLLAAGRASRFGSDKRLARLYKRETLIEAAVRVYAERGLDVLVCLSARPADAPIRTRLTRRGVLCIRCASAGAGMACTLAEGVSRCGAYPGLFVALADMPLILPATVAALEERQSPGSIVFPEYRGRRGHPVLFGADFFPELRRLRGDRGAHSLIAAHPASGAAIAVEDPGILRDADTPAALASLRAAYARRRDSGVSG